MTARLMMALVFLGTVVANTAPVVTNLNAEYRSGQVFLTWKEAPVPDGTTFNVYLSQKPIANETTLAAAKKVCQWIAPHSAEDWTRDNGNLGNGRRKDPKTGEIPPVSAPLGYIITDGGERLDPTSGLHVHTVGKDEAGDCYYAVTVVRDGHEDRTIVAGENALRTSVAQECGPICPIWQGEGKSVAPDSGQGKALILCLHGKGNRAACKYIVFGDATHAWREGIPFMFDVDVYEQSITLRPSDTMYVGWGFNKSIKAASDICGIWTFWYGCSDKIPQPEQIAKGTPINYTERRLLFEIDWVKKHLKTDPNRTYCTGSSMGGCGAMSFAFRHPEIFAAVNAHVPIVAYSEGDPQKDLKLGWHDNTYRLLSYCGPIALICSDGMPLSKRLDSTDFVLSHPDDLPYLVIANGRQDSSIPWHPNPDFYRALQKMRHGCLIAWNNDEHGTVEKQLPPDFKEWTTKGLMRFALNKSFIAFSNCSRNGDPGNGDNNNGDILGYMNRGLNWTDPKETADRYEVLVIYDLDAGDLPLTVDVTPRRCQAFILSPGQTCSAVNITAAGQTIQTVRVQADRFGLATIPKFQLTQREGNRLILTK